MPSLKTFTSNYQRDLFEIEIVAVEFFLESIYKPRLPAKIPLRLHGHIFESSFNQINPTDIYLFKVNNGNTRTICGICSKVTIKTPERRQ